MIKKEQVRELHSDIDEALSQVAKKHGFAYKGGSMRYSDIEISGRMSFVLKNKLREAERRITARYNWGSLQVGDTVRVAHQGHMEYTIVKATSRGSAVIERNSDGKRFRANPSILTKV